MKKLALITYMRPGEAFTAELTNLAISLGTLTGCEFKVIICSETEQTQKFPFTVTTIVSRGTKYKRLLSALAKDDSQYFISIDNDISADKENIVRLFHDMINNNADIAWGRIASASGASFSEKLVTLDKSLSHHIIRPFLWWLGIGITIPGQCFIMRRSAFIDLTQTDTFLDDLAIGLKVSESRLTRLVTGDVLGYENPSSTLSALFTQRKRWARGYASLLFNARTFSETFKLITHGAAYHLAWIVPVGLFLSLLSTNPVASAAIAISSTLAISFRHPQLFIYGAAYQAIFATLHAWWMINVLISANKAWKSSSKAKPV